MAPDNAAVSARSTRDSVPTLNLRRASMDAGLKASTPVTFFAGPNPFAEYKNVVLYGADKHHVHGRPKSSISLRHELRHDLSAK
jgi:hypothetical protein